MSRYRNERSSNKPIEYGNISESFMKMRNLVNVNDGTRSFTMKTVDCHDIPAPFPKGQFTQINITHPDHYISDISKGFMTARVKAVYKLNTDLRWKQNVVDPDHLIKLGVSWKNSNNAIPQLIIYHNNVDVGYQQNEGIREGFIYGALKPENEKIRRRFVHTLWENIANYSNTICGSYTNLDDYRNNNTATTEFDINIPFDDLLALQAFDIFPNGLIGDISLKLKFSDEGLTWMVVEPNVVAEKKAFLEESPLIGVDLLDQTKRIAAISKLKKQFTQIGNEAMIPGKFKIHQKIMFTGKKDSNDIEAKVEDIVISNEFFTNLGIQPTENLELILTKMGYTNISNITSSWYHEYEAQPATLECVDFTITLLKSNMQGHGVVQSTKDAIKEALAEGIVIPSQQVDFNAFPISASSNGIKSSFNIPLMNVTTMSIMFPKHGNDITVFENPIYQNCYLTIAGTNYPDEPLTTIGSRFLEQQLVASDLDSNTLLCTKEFEDSMTMSKNSAGGTRYSNTLSDGTSFIYNVQTERSNAGYCYDGLDSNFGNVQIQINGQPMYTGANDTYYNVDSSGLVHPPPVQLWLTRDTWFSLDLNGLRYHDKTTPPGSQVEKKYVDGVSVPKGIKYSINEY